jgi:hypothetical protein
VKETIVRAILLLVGSAVLSACATSSPPESAPPARHPGQCKAEAGQHLIGSAASAETGAELLRLTGATTLRWVPPRTAVTMDFRADRLTVSYDDDMAITRISCT